MATITLSTAVGNSMLTQLLTALDVSGAGSHATCKLYTGAKPANTGVAPDGTTQRLLGTLTMAYPSGTIASKAMTFDAITSDASADYTGTCTWARFATGAGAAVVDVDASTIGGAGFLQMNTTSIVAGGPISAASCVISI